MSGRGVNRKLMDISLMIMLLIISLFAAVSVTGENGSLDPIRAYTGVHIDLGLYDDTTSDFEFMSRSNARTIRLSSKSSKEESVSFEIGKVSLEMKRVQVSDENGKGTDRSTLFGNEKTKDSRINDPVGSNKLVLKNAEHLNVEYSTTITGLKETVIIEGPPMNLTSDLIIKTKIGLSGEINPEKASKYEWTEGTGPDLVLKDGMGTGLRLPNPILYSSPSIVMTDSGPVKIKETVHRQELKYRYYYGKDHLDYEVVVPFELFDQDLVYPLYIDPSIVSFEGYAEYEGYPNGSVAFRDGTDTAWYHNVDRTVYLESDVTVGASETLIFRNVIVKANQTGIGIEVEDGGSFGVYDETVMTVTDVCDGYSILMKDGSSCQIMNSTVEKAKTGTGVDIGSSDVTVYNSTFRFNGDHGLLVNQSVPIIFDSMFYEEDIGIRILPFSNAILSGNRINNTGIGIEHGSSNIFDDLSTSDNIEKMIGTEHVNGHVEYKIVPENYALTCPSVTVDSTYSSFVKGNMYDGVWDTAWMSGTTEPHYAIFDFSPDQINLTSFKIYHYSGAYRLYDYQVQTWSGSGWVTQFNVDNNGQTLTTHTLGSIVSSQKVRLYITDSTPSSDARARVREFEIYGDDDGEDTHYMLTRPIPVYGPTIFGSLVLDKVEPGESKVYVSILDGETNTTIPGFDELDGTNIDLRWINTTAHPTIKVKAQFVRDGDDEPYIDSWKLYFSTYRSESCDLDSYSDLSDHSDIDLFGGKAHLSGEDLILDEQWGEGWDMYWTVQELYDGGDCYPVIDNWEGSGNDLYIEGKCLTPSPGHDGEVIVSRYFGEVHPNCTLDIHFTGQIDSSIYNYADMMITLYDQSNSTKRQIRWTTRDYSYNGGLSGDTYYIVAQEEDPTTPYANEVTIDSTIEDLFVGYFGEEFNFTTYRYLKIEVLSLENYNQRQNPKVYIDHVRLSNLTMFGSGTTNTFNRDLTETWAYLVFNGDRNDTGDIRLSLLDPSTGSVISGFDGLTSYTTDISSLNDQGILSFQVQFELFYDISAPDLDWITVFTNPLFVGNEIVNNGIGVITNNSLPVILNNVISDSGTIGIHVWEPRTDAIDDSEMSFILSGNVIEDNPLGMFVENTSVNISLTDFIDNDVTIRVHGSSFKMNGGTVQGNGNRMYINNSLAEFTESWFNGSVFDFESRYSRVVFNGVIRSNNDPEQVELVHSTMVFIDVEDYMDIDRTLDGYSVLYCNWSYSFDITPRYDETPAGASALIYNKTGDLVSTVDITDDCQLTGTISERIITQSYESYETPHNFKIGSKNDIYLYMVSPQYHSIYYCYDSDADSIADIAEKDEGKYLFESEDLVCEDKVYELGAVERSTDENIVPIDIHIQEDDLEELEFSFAVRARSINVSADRSFTIDMDDGTIPIDETFEVTPDWRWYQTSWSPTYLAHITGEIRDDDSMSVEIDRFVLLKKNDDTDENPPVLGSPLISDMDDDGLFDGYERTQNGVYIEAEHLSGVTVVSNTTAINSKFGQSTIFSFNVNIMNAGEYKLNVRARSETTETMWINDGNNGSEELTDQFRWFEIGIGYGSTGEKNIKISSNSTVIDVDRITLTKVSDVEITKLSGNVVNVPQWGLATRAEVYYTSESEVRSFDNPDRGTISSLDVDGNLSVYASPNGSDDDITGYNLTTGREYDIEVGSDVHSFKPSISRGEVVYHDDEGTYGGNIWYCDLRSGPDALDPMMISTEGGISYKGYDAKISDGTVVWHSDTGDELYVRFMDSMSFITIEDAGYDIGNFSIYGRTVAWISVDENEYKVRMADVGILADVQERDSEYTGLTPHIQTIAETTNTIFRSVDIYGTSIVYMESNVGLSKLMLYDRMSNTSNCIYAYTSNITYTKPVQIYGSYVCWQETTANYYIKVMEIGSSVQTWTQPSTIATCSLYSGQVYFTYSSSNQIKGYVQDYSFIVDEAWSNTHLPFFTSENVAISVHSTDDLSSELNEALLASQANIESISTEERRTDIVIGLDHDYGTSLTMTGVRISMDSLTDPFSSDVDMDGLTDGEELLGWYNQTIIEVEDTISFKEWIEPDCGKEHSVFTGLAAMFYRYSPMFYVDGVDLMTGDYRYNKDEGDNEFWTNTSSGMAFELPDLGSGKYKVMTVQNERIKSAYSDLDDAEIMNKRPAMEVRGSESDTFGTGNSDLYEELYKLNDTELEYIGYVLDEILVFDYVGSSGENMSVLSETRDYQVLWCYIGRLVDSPHEYYDEESENDLMFLGFQMDYEAEINLGGPSSYRLEIRFDLDLLPDNLDPLLKGTLGEASLVPDGFPVERFNFMRMVNLDSIIIAGHGLNPISEDTDLDDLDDGVEVYLDTFPLTEDGDKDGISDYDEVITYETRPNKRDTDFDGIRDPVELGILSGSLIRTNSVGSWFERKVRNGDYFDLANVSNVDADEGATDTEPTVIDTDRDGLPDGWVDGWGYYGGYFSGLGTSGSMYSTSNWRGGLGYDCLVQVYEGEDIDLDGEVDDELTDWDFDGLTFEFAGSGTAECDPNTPDSDEDHIPDGYEILYGIQEPFLGSSGEFILSPTEGDSDHDLDPLGRDVLSGITPEEPSHFQTVTSTNTRYAQEIVPLTPPDDIKKLAWVGVLVDSEDEVQCIEIWSGNNSGGGEPRDKLKTIYGYEAKEEGEDLTNYIFKVPQGIFFNGLRVGDVFYLVVPYTGTNIDWTNRSDGAGKTCYYSGSGWTELTSIDLCYTLYCHDLVGEGLTNLEEYIIGTDPKDRNSDVGYLGYNDDDLSDFEETVGYFGNGGSGLGEDEVLARTNVENGTLSFDRLLSGSYLSSHKIYYNENPASFDVNEYDYYDNGTEFNCSSLEIVNVFKLRDGSDVIKVTIDEDDYLIVWDTLCLDEEERTVEGTNTIIHCEYIRFISDGSVSATYSIDLSFIGQDIFFSEPCSYDSDWDGILDGEEIGWNDNSDGDYTLRELSQLGTDLVYNVRDRDSDNDGIDDGDEIDWNLTNDGQGLDETDMRENMVDPDSDGDGIWDGWEREYYSDQDSDGLENGIDPDSDNDGLCDGWGDGYIWDSYSGSFVQIYSSGKVYNPSGQVDNMFDLWEGEDKDRDGILDGNETDHLRPDTDCDGLWDGWDVVIDDVVHRGELYETGNTAFDSLMQISGFDYNRVYKPNTPSWEQSGSTNSSDPDTDTDGISDGEEVNGWDLRLEIRYVDPSTNSITRTVMDSIVSDPTLADRDSDGLSDWEEYSNGSLPYETDSDKDGLGDYKECSAWFTSPSDFDTDKDNLPDGWIDGWRRVNATVWKSDRTKNSQREVWEGEDIDGDGVLDALESNPRYRDTDNDHIIDGHEYFHMNITSVMDPWSQVPGTARYYWSYDADGTSNARDNDSDGDGLLDGLEDWNLDGKLEASLSGSTYPNYVMAKESNPYDTDSDDDGLDDGEDVIVGGILYNRADPDGDGVISSMDRDSDGDGELDDEDPNPLYYGDQDNDGDGLSYQMEQVLGLSDNDADCDNDGIRDGDEVKNGTDPSDEDTDDDGLTDGYELVTSRTDPLKYDTDNDGISDKVEYINMSSGLDPFDPDVDDDGLSDGNPFEGVRDYSLNVKQKAQWTNSDSNFETILGEPFTYNFNDEDSDGDGLKDGYEIGIMDKDGNLIGDMNKSVIDGDTDNDRVKDSVETWLNLDPLNYDTDGDYVPDGWIDGWTRNKDGTWHLDKSLRDGVKDLHEGESICYDGTVTFMVQREINANSGTKTDTEGDTLPDWLDRWMGANPDSTDTDGDEVTDNLDLEPLINSNIHFSFFLKSFFVMDDTSLDFPNDKPDPLFTCDLQSRGTFTDSWKDSDHGGAEIAERKVEKGYCNDPCDQYGSDYLYKISRGFVVQNLPSDHYQLLFAIRMYDKDSCSADDQVDISPCSSYTLEVFYDVVTGMWAVWDDMSVIRETSYNTYLNDPDNLKEGVYLYKNQNDSYTVIRETEKGTPVAGIGDGIGYVTGFEPGSKDLKEAGGIQFEIAPMYLPEDRDSGFFEDYDYYSDYDHDGLTTLTEKFWLNNTILFNNRPLNCGTLDSSLWDKDGDNVSDGWEIKYGFDPCDNSSPNKNDDGDQDGISDYNEYCLEDTPGFFVDRNVTIKYHNMSKWGAQPDRQDIFVEVDWMKKHIKTYIMMPQGNGEYKRIDVEYDIEYKMSEEAKDKVILAFFKACKYGNHITLHIDDGCMGGGETIPYQEINYIDIIPGVNNDIYDIKWGNDWNITYKEIGEIEDICTLNMGDNNNFNYERFRVFYYCVFDKCLESNDNTIQNIIFKTHLGQSDGYDTFCISKGHPILNDGYYDGLNVAGVFMHELGHCLSLNRDSEGVYGFDVLGPKTCMNYRDIYDTIDYSENEWSMLDLLSKANPLIRRY